VPERFAAVVAEVADVADVAVEAALTVKPLASIAVGATADPLGCQPYRKVWPVVIGAVM
jgi:hypothetical protein